ncbi:hypothetical protein EKO27_g6024 [Xylaria grammica]|uniref:Uncharacterized protein n=1 Tax=Xylaria grammica TaxID=363999 RepID=A0A439D3V7_9PEZI|nr:hypothetical protein EKO27_g6024 [Xylaria grammica]
MRKASFIFSLSAFRVTAIYWSNFTFFGYTLDGVLDDGDARDAIDNASRYPTLSRSVTFRPFEQDWGSLTDSSAIRNSEWTWRINVTNIAASDADLRNATEDAHVVAATYDFAWSVDGNISAALDHSTSPLCIASLGGEVDLPVNITNAYKEDSGSSCVPVLGQACVDAMLAQAPVPGLQDCNETAAISWSSIPECRDSFGVSSRTQGVFSVSRPGFNLSTNAKYSWESGQGFFWDVKEPVSGTNSQVYHNLGNKVHILMMYTDLRGRKLGPQLLCSRANVTELPDNGPDDDGVILTGEAVLESGALSIFERRAASKYLWTVLATVSLTVFTFL